MYDSFPASSSSCCFLLASLRLRSSMCRWYSVCMPSTVAASTDEGFSSTAAETTISVSERSVPDKGVKER